MFTKWPTKIGRNKPLVYPLVVWKPPEDNVKAYDDWLERILKARQPALIVIDEVSSLGKGSALSYAPALPKVLKQGRGLYIPCIVESQEAHLMPRQILGQASHMIRFGLKNEADNEKLDKELLPAPPIADPFGFHYYQSTGGRIDGPYYYRSHQDFFLAA